MARSFNVEKQVTFALAKTLTGVVKEAQATVIHSVESTFTVRNNWLQPGNRMGVRVQAATKSDLTAGVGMAADWLIGHEEGEDKTPHGKYLAIPSRNVRRTKRDIIQRGQRPKNLRGKRDVVLPLSGGGYGLFQRKGRRRNSKLVFLYTLRSRSVHLRRQPTVIAPTINVFEKRFSVLLEKNLRAAFKTAR